MNIHSFLRGVAICSLCLLLPATVIAATKSVKTPPRVEITPVTDDIIRVTNYGVYPDVHYSSASVVLPPAHGLNTVTSDTRSRLTLTTASGVTATLDKNSGAVTITDGRGNTITDSGLREIGNDGRQRLAIGTGGTSSFYGAGERGYSFNLRGDTLVMYNKQNYGYTAGESRIRQMNITMPMFVSSDGYALLFDDFGAGEMIMSDPIEYITVSKHPVSYYFIAGGSLEKVMKNYTALTGRQKLPPLWSLGYITSKYGYRTQEETTGVIDTLKNEGYPVDGVVLDLYWYGKEEDMGRLAWDPQQWPDHVKMLADLKERGVNTVIISQPYILRNGRGLDNYNQLNRDGMLVRNPEGGSQEVTIWVGEGGMFDMSNPATRKWLADRYRTLTDEGVGGWWGDLGEPEVHPETGVHANGLTTSEYHNQYGNDWSSIIFNLFEEQYPDRRLMTMMRGGTAGLQRYSVFPWSTDVSRTWGGLAPQVTIMLNSGLSGLGYMSHDVGGFAITDPDRVTDPELYVRWLQLGTFSPVLRTHAQQLPEPYLYKEHQHIIRPLIKERYRWLPYNYTLAYENASQGLPLVRPLNFYTPGVTSMDSITDQYLWGRDVMVAPVLTQGAVERSVTFPAGMWLDMSDPSRIYAGGTTVTVPAPLDVLPLFVRAGSFIPLADYTMENTGDYRSDVYTMAYYPVTGVTSSYTLYEDNTLSNKSLERGEYALITFRGDATESKIDIRINQEGTYPAAPERRSFDFNVYRVETRPANVAVNGRSLDKDAWTYEPGRQLLTFTVEVADTKAATVTITK